MSFKSTAQLKSTIESLATTAYRAADKFDSAIRPFRSSNRDNRIERDLFNRIGDHLVDCAARIEAEVDRANDKYGFPPVQRESKRERKRRVLGGIMKTREIQRALAKFQLALADKSAGLAFEAYDELTDAMEFDPIEDDEDEDEPQRRNRNRKG